MHIYSWFNLGSNFANFEMTQFSSLIYYKGAVNYSKSFVHLRVVYNAVEYGCLKTQIPSLTSVAVWVYGANKNLANQ